MPLSDQDKRSIFSALEKVLLEFSPPLVIKSRTANSIELIGNTPVPYGYKKEIVPGMYFASALIRKDNVSFYFFPIYMAVDAYKNLAPGLLKHLDGKTCFHFKKPEHFAANELRAILQTGIAHYKKQGWIK